MDVAILREKLVGPYAAVDVVASTGSTNADLLALAETGAPDRTVLIAGEQTAGRGRRSRAWVSPPGTGLYLSVLLRPAGVAPAGLGTLAMVAGLALADTAASVGVLATLKWPNDLLAGDAKCAGVLAEVAGEPDRGVVVGIGLNVGPLGGQAPAGPGGLAATSLAEAGASVTDLTDVAVLLLTAFAERETRWRAAGGDLAGAGLLADYRAACSTLGSPVRVELPVDKALHGIASDVDADGRLLVLADDGTRHTVSAGDVVHLRTTA